MRARSEKALEREVDAAVDGEPVGGLYHHFASAGGTSLTQFFSEDECTVVIAPNGALTLHLRLSYSALATLVDGIQARRALFSVISFTGHPIHLIPRMPTREQWTLASGGINLFVPDALLRALIADVPSKGRRVS